MALKTTVIHTTETIGGKVYPVKITKCVGLQEFEAYGEKFMISSLTITEGELGRSRSWTRVPQVEPTPEERAHNRQIVREIATQCMVDQGIW